MSNKPSNTPVVAIIVVILLAVLAIPCLLGALFLGASFFSGDEPTSPSQPMIIEGEPDAPAPPEE